ncbi:MAG: DUF2075 domain-containing protein [Gemmatimonadota bacterium]|nr:DUF2075 domain-containing protein [Gemmatimonadota bacterium]MDQ8177612.1 DUF2075 domain-containing protein [Gemmatimonadota bacterium]
MTTASIPVRRSGYASPIREFRSDDIQRILGELTANGGDVLQSQVGAWLREIEIMKSALEGIDGWIIFEFDVPRLGSRIDVVVLFGRNIVPIEFKVDQDDYSRQDIDQAWDYALDLKNFHRGSHNAHLWPILCATAARATDRMWDIAASDSVRPPRRVNAEGLKQAIRDIWTDAMASGDNQTEDGETWAAAPYQPTPTIIQAAQALYSRHSVDAITRNDAGENLSITSRTVEEVIRTAEAQKDKCIVFVTGVPGAGKTLVGLNIATANRDDASSSHAVFLSGNGPLVAVLTESLARDELNRQRAAGKKKRKGDVKQPIKQFIQNVHHFRDDGIKDLAAPHDRVVIFDEAQRAWDLKKTADFMKRRKGRPGFKQSEPEFLISYMDRHPDWAVIVCLVGGGQEINTGEAGIGAWLTAISSRFRHWQVYLSPNLGETEYRASRAIQETKEVASVREEVSLHLAASMRSFRSERLSEFVRLVLECEEVIASELAGQVASAFPLVVTRDLAEARRWVRRQARGTQQYGLLASSSAHRLKPHAVDIRFNIDPVHWFLGNRDDTRSSYYLEDAATEFQVQGLELDWSIVSWDADLRKTPNGWSYNEFRGSKWNRVQQPERQRYLLNAYRVLLTRARQGTAIFIPEGVAADPTRKPEFYDGTFEYFCRLGLDVI